MHVKFSWNQTIQGLSKAHKPNDSFVTSNPRWSSPISNMNGDARSSLRFRVVGTDSLLGGSRGFSGIMVPSVFLKGCYPKLIKELGHLQEPNLLMVLLVTFNVEIKPHLAYLCTWMDLFLLIYLFNVIGFPAFPQSIATQRKWLGLHKRLQEPLRYGEGPDGRVPS